MYHDVALIHAYFIAAKNLISFCIQMPLFFLFFPDLLGISNRRSVI